MRSALIPNFSPAQLPWHPIVLLSLAIWCGASLLLDLLIMPTLYAGGMMDQAGFASTGYQLFGEFNHIELLLGAVALTGLLALTRPFEQLAERDTKSLLRLLWPALLLFLIPLLYTYGLTPQMSALGLTLEEGLGETPLAMNLMHGAYWILEVVKFGAIALLLYRLAGRFGLSDSTVVRLSKPE